MIFLNISKLRLIYYFVILFLIKKSSSIRVNDVEVLKLNEFIKMPSFDDKINELSKYLDHQTWEINLNTNYKFYENLAFIYEYNNKIVQVILLTLFGVVCDWKEIQTILRFPVGLAIAAFCRWFYVPLVS